MSYLSETKNAGREAWKWPIKVTLLFKLLIKLVGSFKQEPIKMKTNCMLIGKKGTFKHTFL